MFLCVDVMGSARFGLLQGNKLFEKLTEDQVREILPCLEEERFPEGAEIIRESQPGDRVFLLVEGQAKVRKHLIGSDEEVEIALLSPGDFFGEMSFFGGEGERSASVYALTPAVAFSLSQTHFSSLLSRHPEVVRNILSNIVIQLQASHQRYIERLRKEKGDLAAEVDTRTRELAKLSERISREMVVAQNIQKNLLPEKKIRFPGVSISTEYIPCEELSGDITGVFPIDERRIGIYGGDVCGHGIYAAMIMSYVKKLIETSMKRMLIGGSYVAKPPGAVLTAINRSFIAEVSLGDPEIYLSLFLGILDLRDFHFEYSSAGAHIPPLTYRNGEVKELFDVSDFSIGHVPNHVYRTDRVSFAPGHALFFASDGVAEARRGEESFGMDRLKSEAFSMLSGPGEPDLGMIVEAVNRFLDGERHEDDMCLFIMRVE
jgi:serine phosphatase RsbU (regulator of sigma subunit)